MELSGESRGRPLHNPHVVFIRHKKHHKTVKLVDWAAFHKTENFPFSQTPKSYFKWVTSLLKTEVTKTIKTIPEAPALDAHLLHLWDARRQLAQRWKRQKLNRRLETRAATPTAEAEKYAIDLAKKKIGSRSETPLPVLFIPNLSACTSCST